MRKILFSLLSFAALFAFSTFSAEAAVADDKLNLACPVKIAFRLVVKGDNLIMPDQNWLSENPDARYCATQTDFEYCEKVNPEKAKVPCRLLDPALNLGEVQGYCPLVRKLEYGKEKSLKFLGLFETNNKKINITISVFGCSRPWALDSCRRYLQHDSITALRDGTIFSDKTTDVSYNSCELDEAGSSQYLQQMNAYRPTLTAKLQAYQRDLLAKCGQKISCLREMNDAWDMAVIDANARVGVYDSVFGKDNPDAIMTGIQVNYRPLAEDVVDWGSTYSAAKPALKGECAKNAEAFRYASRTIYGIEAPNTLIRAWCLQSAVNPAVSKYAAFLAGGQYNAGHAQELMLANVRANPLERNLIIENVYLDTFGRTPTLADEQYWRKAFNSSPDGLLYYKTMAKQARDFLNNNPAEREATIKRAYKWAFGREASKGDLDYWKPRTENYTEIVKAALDYMYNNNPATELQPMAIRVCANIPECIKEAAGVNARVAAIQQRAAASRLAFQQLLDAPPKTYRSR